MTLALGVALLTALLLAAAWLIVLTAVVIVADLRSGRPVLPDDLSDYLREWWRYEATWVHVWIILQAGVIVASAIVVAVLYGPGRVVEDARLAVCWYIETVPILWGGI